MGVFDRYPRNMVAYVQSKIEEHTGWSLTLAAALLQHLLFGDAEKMRSASS